jgi:hypothetical protein
MTRVEEIEKAIARLKPDELTRLRRWFDRLDAKAWDEQISRDAREGKLDKLARQAIKAHERGKTKEL